MEFRGKIKKYAIAVKYDKDSERRLDMQPPDINGKLLLGQNITDNSLPIMYTVLLKNYTL